MLVSAVVLALYFWAYFADVSSLNSALLVSDMAAIAAGVALVVGFVSYLWAPKQAAFWNSYIAYMVLCLMAGLLVVNTGTTESPFLALWMAVSVFAAVFGMWGVTPLAIALGIYTTLAFTTGTLTQRSGLTLILGGLFPLLVGYFIWHSKAKGSNGDKAYRELATELSQVAGKSEVVINAIADGVIALDNKGLIQLINPAAQQIIGWGKQDALSLDYKSVLKLIDKNDAELTTANDPVLQVLATNKETINNDLTLLTSAGKKKLVSIIVSPIGQQGAGVIIVFRDITAEKAQEREKAEFVSTASHEMRTPVASIEGYLGLALNPATANIDEKAREYINKAHESAQHLGDLFQDLLDITKADDGRMTNNPKVVDVVAFTKDVTDSMRSKASAKQLRMLYKPEPEDNGADKGGERRISPVYYANVDNGHLREILSNLIDNAIKYTPKGDVVIDVTGDSEHVTISVADSGIGIPKEDQAHLFQKFYRVDNTDTREIGGTGLGLYLCRKLAESMQGRIWVESEYKRGSTFYLEIPRIDHEEAMRLIESAAEKPPTVTDVTPETPTLSIPTPRPEVVAQEPQISKAPQPLQQSPPQTDATYSNPPVEQIRQQLTQATPPMQPLPTAPNPTVHTYRPPIAAQGPLPNTPLSSIEQHPNQYLRRPESIAVPPREQKQP